MWTRKRHRASAGRPGPGPAAAGLFAAVVISTAVPAAAVSEAEPNDSSVEAQDLTAGLALATATASGGLVVQGALQENDIDFYAVDLQLGEQLTVVVTDADAGEFNDGRMAVYDPNGTLVASDDDAGPGFHPQLVVPVSATGSWQVAVTGFSDKNFQGFFHEQDFAYRLVVAVEAVPPLASEVDSSPPPGLNDTQATADPMAADAEAATVSGFSDNNPRDQAFVPDDLDFFSVGVQAGELVTASVVDPDSGADADAVVEIYDGNGVLVASNDDGGPRLLAHAQTQAVTGGSYRVAVRGFDYFYTFLAVPATPLPQPDFPYQLVVSRGFLGESLLCDVDGNGQVDQLDVQLILDARGQPAAGPDDPMDVDGDGTITVLDGRACVLECTFPNCATTGCGLLGIEPMLLVGAALLWRRRRARRS